MVKVACSGPGVSRTRNLLVTTPILYQLDHCNHVNGRSLDILDRWTVMVEGPCEMEGKLSRQNCPGYMYGGICSGEVSGSKVMTRLRWPNLNAVLYFKTDIQVNKFFSDVLYQNHCHDLRGRRFRVFLLLRIVHTLPRIQGAAKRLYQGKLQFTRKHEYYFSRTL